MGYVIRLGIILMVVACISAGGLALLNTQTAPIIEEYKRMEQERARLEVMPEAAPVRCPIMKPTQIPKPLNYSDTSSPLREMAIPVLLKPSSASVSIGISLELRSHPSKKHPDWERNPWKSATVRMIPGSNGNSDNEHL